MMQKWQYKIKVKVKNRSYLIWTYSKHFEEIEKLTRRQKRLLKHRGCRNVNEHEGLAHSLTAIQWVNAIRRTLKKQDAKSTSDVVIVKDGLFNPHYRLSSETYPDVWVKVEDVKHVYFEMFLIDVPEKKAEI